MNFIEHLSRQARGVFYGWWLVGISGFVRTSGIPLFHAMGLWFVALEAQFAWNPGLTISSVCFYSNRKRFARTGGRLFDRSSWHTPFSVYRIVDHGSGVFSFWASRPSLGVLYRILIMALGQGLSGWLPITTMLNNWFVRRRSSAMGWSNSGSRLGALLLIPLLAWSIDPDHGYLGWSLTASILGLFFLAVAFPISALQILSFFILRIFKCVK